MIIAVDFDGTLCANAWPEIGAPNDKLIDFLLERKRDYGDKLILWTMREGADLLAALYWCADRGLSFDAVNDNDEDLKKRYNNNPRKVFANWYIDDHNAEHFTDFPQGIY